MYQYRLPLNFIDTTGEHTDIPTGQAYRKLLIDLLGSDLDFHAQDSGYASHNFHSFPAKFPPQLPRKFIAALTAPGDLVLDPMMGSGTTVLEAFLSGRYGLGFDIDPLAVMLSRVKTTPISTEQTARIASQILGRARYALSQHKEELKRAIQRRWDDDTRQFVDYWFAPETQVELMALIGEIERLDDPGLRFFFELVFSSVIITKWGGVSLAIDLAHTRPHRAKVVTDPAGKVLIGDDSNDSSQRARVLTKRLRSPLQPGPVALGLHSPKATDKSPLAIATAVVWRFAVVPRQNELLSWRRWPAQPLE